MPSFVPPYGGSLVSDASREAPDRPSPEALLRACGRWFADAYRARQAREIARFIEERGGLSDEVERALSRRFGGAID